MPDIVLKNITKRFGNVVAADDVSLEIKDGEYVTLLGPSGCGKTTLIKILSGIWEPTEGEVFIDGRKMNGIPVYERELGYVFQNIALFPHMTVWQNVMYGPIAKDWERVKGEKLAGEYLELVNLLERQGFYPHELSGGAQQKVGLARALSSGAKLIILDEPLSALDSRVRLSLRYELRKLVKDLGLTALHVTHDQEEAMSISDRIVLMRKGRIIEENTPEELYNRPKSLFTANFIGESNFIQGAMKKVENHFGLMETRNRQFIRIKANGHKAGDAVVLSIRPETLKIKRERKEGKSPTSMAGTVIDRIFMGTYWRYQVKLKSDDIILVDAPIGKEKFNEGETAFILFDHEKTLVYERPYEGLMEVLKLE